MTKFNEITDPNERTTRISYVDKLWSSYEELHLQAFTRVINYLFVLNTGALLGTLTYVTAKSLNSFVLFSIYCFVLGIVTILLHACVGFYSTKSNFDSYATNVKKYYENSINWADVEGSSRWFDWLLNLFGLISGISFIVGLVVGISQIK